VGTKASGTHCAKPSGPKELCHAALFAIERDIEAGATKQVLDMWKRMLQNVVPLLEKRVKG
jgi:hypothetical protein